METTLLTLSKIFTERLFRIPDYQRGYAWTEKQLKDFWSDLEQLEIGKNHYVGVLTLERVDEKSFNKWDDDKWIIKSKKYEPYYIVDGQQRLTTAIILIEAIVESLNENEELNYTSVCDIRRKYIFEEIKNKFVGKWNYAYITGNEALPKISDIYGEDVKIQLTLNADGTFEELQNGKTYTGTEKGIPVSQLGKLKSGASVTPLFYWYSSKVVP